MKKLYISSLFWCLFVFTPFSEGHAQSIEIPSIQSQEVSEKDGIPVLIKHLPNWQDKQKSAVLVDNSDDLRNALGERPVLSVIEFIQGTEAVTAAYDEGKLLIVECNTPQTASLMDQKIKEYISNSDQKVFHRRIGNYNVLLFDGKDEISANNLFDQIKYQKIVQWLGSNHTLFKKKERAFIVGTSSLFISTVFVIVSIFGVAIILGLIVGVIYFYRRDKRLASMGAFSDAGGMIRLNLDGLTPDAAPNRIVKK